MGNLKIAVIGKVDRGAGNRVKPDIGFGLNQSGVSGKAFMQKLYKKEQ